MWWRTWSTCTHSIVHFLSFLSMITWHHLWYLTLPYRSAAYYHILYFELYFSWSLEVLSLHWPSGVLHSFTLRLKHVFTLEEDRSTPGGPEVAHHGATTNWALDPYRLHTPVAVEPIQLNNVVAWKGSPQAFITLINKVTIINWIVCVQTTDIKSIYSMFCCST